MPKIIDDIKESIIQEAKRQVFTEGYINMTIRSVAKECKIAVGTIYNYFSSKDALVASFMLEDWHISAKNMQEKGRKKTIQIEVFKTIYDELLAYMDNYGTLFLDEESKKSAMSLLRDYHKYLREQVTDVIKNCTKKSQKVKSEFLSEFVAESLLAWAAERHPFEDVVGILKTFY